MSHLLNNKLAVIPIVLFIVALAFSGCDADQMQNIAGPDSHAYTDITSQDTLAKPNGSHGIDGEGYSKTPWFTPANRPKAERETYLEFPYTSSKTFPFNPDWNHYEGGTIKIGTKQGSHFHVNDSALTPPPEIPWGDPVTITMEVDYNIDTQEMVFTFDPHGSQFSPPARIKLDYRVMGIDSPQLYYIDEKGKRIPQTPDNINPKKRFMFIYVDHFSRYALGRG